MYNITSGSLAKSSIMNENFTLLKNSINVESEYVNYLITYYSSSVTPISGFVTTETLINDTTIEAYKLNNNYDNCEDYVLECKIAINGLIVEQSLDVEADDYTFTLNNLVDTTQIIAEPHQENFILLITALDSTLNRVIDIFKTESIDTSLVSGLEHEEITKTTSYNLSQYTINVEQKGSLLYNSSNNKSRYLTLLYERLGGGMVGVKYDLQTKTILQTTYVLNENLPSYIGESGYKSHYTRGWFAEYWNDRLIITRIIQSEKDASTSGREYIIYGLRAIAYDTQGLPLTTSSWYTIEFDIAYHFHVDYTHLISYNYNNTSNLVVLNGIIEQSYDYSDEDPYFFQSRLAYNGVIFSFTTTQLSNFVNGRESTSINMVYTFNNNKIDYSCYVDTNDSDPFSGMSGISVNSFDITTNTTTNIHTSSTNTSDGTSNGYNTVEGQVIKSYWYFDDEGDDRCRFVYTKNGSIILDTNVINGRNRVTSYKQFSNGSEHYFKEITTGYEAFFGVDFDSNTKVDITEYSDLPTLTNLYYVNSLSERMYYTINGSTLTFWNDSETFIDYKITLPTNTTISNILYIAKNTIKPFYNNFLTTHLNQNTKYELYVTDENDNIIIYNDSFLLDNLIIKDFTIRLILPYYTTDTSLYDLYYFIR